MQKNQIIEAKIESLSHDGRGISIINGKTTFITGALAKETVSCQITKIHSRFNEAKTIAIVQASPNRIHPLCAHSEVCGGCSLQHMNELAQIQLKEKTLLEQLKHFGKVSPEKILPPLVGPIWHYRRKARLGVRYVIKKEKMLVGFREKSSNYLTDIQSCQVLASQVGLKITELQHLIRSLTQYDQIPQIEVAKGDKDTALVFRHLTDLPEEDKIKLKNFAEKHHFQIYLQPNSPEKICKIWPEDNNHYLSYLLPDYALELFFHPLDFIQINADINRLMIKNAMTLLEPTTTDKMLDLFCGLGNFTLPFARLAQYVTGIEGSAEMVNRAHQNAVHNKLVNVEFHAANLQNSTQNDDWCKRSYDKILLDPPRTGAKEILPYFKNFAARKILYISCNPATLARDAGELVHTAGYHFKCVGVVNMFPHTNHIEAMALFEK